MRFYEILNEGPQQDSIDPEYIEFELQDHDLDTMHLAILFGESDEYIPIIVSYEVTANETDASFGYEYWGATGVHHQTDVEGDVEVTDYDIDPDVAKDDPQGLRAAARALRVPGRKSKDPQAVLKYFEHAFKGGSKGLMAAIEKYIRDNHEDDLIDQELESRKGYRF